MTLDSLKEEIKTAGLATVFFLCAFLFVIALKKLFLAQYDIGFYGLSVAVFGAAVVGKVVVVLDKLRAGTRFEASRPPWVSVTYKTVVYSAAVMLVVATERVFHAYRESGALGSAIGEVWHGRDRNNILATVLCIGAAFAAYNVVSTINRHLAGGRLGAWLLGRAEGDGRDG
jgi:hypothetical protein